MYKMAKEIPLYVWVTFSVLVCFSTTMQAQNNPGGNRSLEPLQQHIVTISSFTAKGDQDRLKKALNEGLDAGLTINECKEVLVHLYAYCGFPRSISGLNTLINVLEERKAKGKQDKVGKVATPVEDKGDKYERGKKVLETLTGRPDPETKTGYAVFSPEIEVFLKEHLFADLFSRDVLSYADREIATVSALVNLGGVEPMIQGHMGIALHIGITESGLRQILSLIEASGGKKEAEAGRQVLSTVLTSRGR